MEDNIIQNSDLDEFGTDVPEQSDAPDVPEPCDPEDTVVVSLDELMEEVGLSSNNKKDEHSMNYTQWTSAGPGTYMAIPPSFSKLYPGVYTVGVKQGHVQYHKKDIKVDDLLIFPDSQSDKILNEITSFWKKGKTFKKYGFLHRRGYLLWGPQGSGKTAIVQLVVAEIVKSGGIVFICDHPSILEMALEEFRTIEKDRPIVCLFEDVDAIIKKHGEDELLSLLDGETQIDKVLNIATTNYPEQIDKRIVRRPRRFDRRIKIGMPNDEVRKIYFQKKLKIADSEIDKWVKATDKFSFASCAELVISVKCLGIEFNEAVTILEDLMNKKESSDDDRDLIGYKAHEKPGLAGLFAEPSPSK